MDEVKETNVEEIKEVIQEEKVLPKKKLSKKFMLAGGVALFALVAFTVPSLTKTMKMNKLVSDLEVVSGRDVYYNKEEKSIDVVAYMTEDELGEYLILDFSDESKAYKEGLVELQERMQDIVFDMGYALPVTVNLAHMKDLDTPINEKGFYLVVTNSGIEFDSTEED